LSLWQEEIYRLEKGIESDQKLKHMAELQLSVVSDPASKHQIQVWKAFILENILTVPTPCDVGEKIRKAGSAKG
jgi:hypothetical protein